MELQSLASHIAPGDVELLEAAGVPEHPEASHTPGPWIVAQHGDQLNIEGRYTAVARTIGEIDATVRADFALIAAAPDLLTELETVLKRLDMEPTDAVFPCSAMREDIRAAIAKARGGA